MKTRVFKLSLFKIYIIKLFAFSSTGLLLFKNHLYSIRIFDYPAFIDLDNL